MENSAAEGKTGPDLPKFHFLETHMEKKIQNYSCLEEWESLPKIGEKKKREINFQKFLPCWHFLCKICHNSAAINPAATLFRPLLSSAAEQSAGGQH